jgi:nicotinate-nucleotide adenylyltransferase
MSKGRKMKEKKKVVIFGGSFDPPHIGHVLGVKAVLDLFPCEEIWVMPSANRHDKSISSSPKHRLLMVRIMIEEAFRKAKVPVKISRFEVGSKELTTTFGTLKKLGKKFPGNEFHFLVGSDSLRNMRKIWVKGEWLFDHGRFLVFRRPGSSLPRQLPRHCTVLRTRQTDVSSTAIRNAVKENKDIDAYVPPGVAKYVRQNKLYK